MPDRALVSEVAARRQYKALVRKGFAETDQDGQTTLYRRNSDRILMSRIQEPRDEADRSGLFDEIKRTIAEIRRFEVPSDEVSLHTSVTPQTQIY